MLAVKAQPTNPVLADGSCRKRISKGMKPSLPKSMVWISWRSFQSQTLSDFPYDPKYETVCQLSIIQAAQCFDNFASIVIRSPILRYLLDLFQVIEWLN